MGWIRAGNTGSCRASVETLERRTLLAAAPAELVVRLPEEPASVNIAFQRLTRVGDRLLFVGASERRPETLYIADGAGGATVLFTATTTSGDGLGIQALTPYHGKLYFFANAPEGDGLFVSDGTPEGTGAVKIFRPGANTLPDRMWILNDRLRFVWDDFTSPAREWASDGTADGTDWVGPPPMVLPPAPSYGRAPTDPSVENDRDGRIGLVSAGWPTPDAPHTVRYLATGHFYMMHQFPMTGGRILVEGVNPAGIHELWSLDPTVVTGSIRGRAYEDLNGNGRFEGFEPYIAGGGAYLDLNDNDHLDGDDFLLPAPSDGTYEAIGLPAGRYTLRVDARDPAGVLPGGGERVIDLAPGENVAGADFYRPHTGGVIWGTVYDDADGDGTRDEGESPGPTLYLYVDLNGNGVQDASEPSKTTAADGSYGFDPVAPGTYAVRLRYHPALRQTVPAAGPAAVVTVTGTGAAEAPPVGVQRVVPGVVNGTAWFDWNRNGVLDGEDTLAAGTAYLDLNGDGLLTGDEPATGLVGFGRFKFNAVRPGEAVVVVTPNTNTRLDMNQYAVARGVNVVPGQTVELPPFLLTGGLGAAPDGGVAGTVWFDRDGDGVRDPDEPGIVGRTVWIDVDRDGNVDVTEPRDTTDADGRYAFPHLGISSQLPVRQRLPDPTWTQTLPAAPAGGTPVGYDVTFQYGQQLTGLDFGSRSDETTPPAVAGATYGAGPDGRALLRVTFSEELSAQTPRAEDLTLTERATGRLVPTGTMAVDFDGVGAAVRFPGLPGGALPAGDYAAVFAPGGVTDAAGNALAAEARVEFGAAALVAGRHVFYNNSSFDGRDPAAGAADDGAVATDKTALLPGEPLRFANYTSYSRGINGIMVDLAGLPGDVALGAGDFEFGAGTAPDVREWSAAPAPAVVSLRRGAGVNGSDRVTLTWADGAIVNRLLRVTVLPTPGTRLASADVFYFGNVVGETGNAPPDTAVTALDLALARANQLRRNVPVTDRFDFNRDGNVNAVDLGLVRANQLRSLRPFSSAPVVVPGPRESAARESVVAAMLRGV